ncbi:two-component system, sensor histidine kinase PdtaS [Hyphomicrobium sp. 1Nfss2.1]
MAEYVPGLCNSLKEALCGPRAISLTSRAVAAMLPPEKALSIGLIVNELVTNAVKYAFEEGRAGKVHVDLSRENSRFLLTVSDDGRGYSPAAEASLGTRLVTTFASQLVGSATWANGPNGGCVITVAFPV